MTPKEYEAQLLEDALSLIDSAVEFSTPEIRGAFKHVRQTIADLQARALDEDALMGLLRKLHAAYFTSECHGGCGFISKGEAVIREEIARRKGTT